MRFSLLVSAVPLLVTSALAAPTPPAGIPPPPVQYDTVHKYIQIHWKTGTYGGHVVPEWVQDRFGMSTFGEPLLSNREDMDRFASCARFNKIPVPKVYGGWPYETPLQRELMEICVLYALEIIPDEAVEAKIPLDEIVRRYGLGPADYDVDDMLGSNEPSQFSLDNVVKNAAPYFGGRKGGQNVQRKPVVPGLRVGH